MSMDKMPGAHQYRLTPVQFISEKGDGLAHLSSHSGYDQLPFVFNGARVPPMVVFRKPAGAYRALTVLPRYLLRRAVTRSSGRWYSLSSFVRIELMVAKMWLRSRGTVFHLLHGETHFRHLGLLTGRVRTNRLVATFHLPPAMLEKLMPRPFWLANLDAVIALGRKQAEWLARWARPGAVHFVPHGVDAEFFLPGTRPDSFPARCAFVGAHLRDLDMLREVILRIAAGQPERRVQFDLVVAPSRRAQFEGLPNTVLHDRLSDEGLRDLYRRADLVLQPLHDAVANNVILEAMACGAPLVVTDVGDVNDYVDASFAERVAPGDALGMASAISRLLAQPEHLRLMRHAARRQAEHFAWPRVVDRLACLYRTLFEPQEVPGVGS